MEVIGSMIDYNFYEYKWNIIQCTTLINDIILLSQTIIPYLIYFNILNIIELLFTIAIYTNYTCINVLLKTILFKHVFSKFSRIILVDEFNKITSINNG